MPKRIGFPTDPAKMMKLADMRRASPFCYGFLYRHLSRGATPDQLRDAIVKSASLDPEVAKAWNDLFEKVGVNPFGNVPNMSTIFNNVRQGANQAIGAAGRVVGNIGNAVKSQLTPTPTAPAQRPLPAPETRESIGAITSQPEIDAHNQQPRYLSATKQPEVPKGTDPTQLPDYEHTFRLGSKYQPEYEAGNMPLSPNLPPHVRAAVNDFTYRYLPQQAQLYGLPKGYNFSSFPAHEQWRNQVGAGNAPMSGDLWERYRKGYGAMLNGRGAPTAGPTSETTYSRNLLDSWNQRKIDESRPRPGFMDVMRGIRKDPRLLLAPIFGHEDAPIPSSPEQDPPDPLGLNPIQPWERVPGATRSVPTGTQQLLSLLGDTQMLSVPNYIVPRVAAGMAAGGAAEALPTLAGKVAPALAERAAPAAAEGIGALPAAARAVPEVGAAGGAAARAAPVSNALKGVPLVPHTPEGAAAAREAAIEAARAASKARAGALLEGVDRGAPIAGEAATSAATGAPAAAGAAAEGAPAAEAAAAALKPRVSMGDLLAQADKAPNVVRVGRGGTGGIRAYAGATAEAGQAVPKGPGILQRLLSPYKMPEMGELAGGPVRQWLGQFGNVSYNLERALQKGLQATRMPNAIAQPVAGAAKALAFPWRLATGEGALTNALRGGRAGWMRAQGYGAGKALLPLLGGRLADQGEIQETSPAAFTTGTFMPWLDVPLSLGATAWDKFTPESWGRMMPSSMPTAAHLWANNLKSMDVLRRTAQSLPQDPVARAKLMQAMKMAPATAGRAIQSAVPRLLGGGTTATANTDVAKLNQLNEEMRNATTPADKAQVQARIDEVNRDLELNQGQSIGRRGHDLVPAISPTYALENMRKMRDQWVAGGGTKEQIADIDKNIADEQAKLDQMKLSDIEKSRLENYRAQIEQARGIIGQRPLTDEERQGRFGSPATPLGGMLSPFTTVPGIVGGVQKALQGGTDDPEIARRSAFRNLARMGLTPDQALGLPNFAPPNPEYTQAQQFSAAAARVPGLAGLMPGAPSLPVGALGLSSLIARNAPPGMTGQGTAPTAAAPTGHNIAVNAPAATTAPAAAAGAAAAGAAAAPPPAQVQQNLATRIAQMPDGEMKQRATALHHLIGQAGGAFTQKAQSLGYSDPQDPKQWSKFVADPNVRQEAAKALVNDPTFQKQFPDLDPEKAMGVSLGIWDRMSDMHKMFLFGGLSVAALSMLTSMFSGDDDDDEKKNGGGGLGMLSPLLGIGGLAAAGYGISGGQPRRLIDPSFYRLKTTAS